MGLLQALILLPQQFALLIHSGLKLRFRDLHPLHLGVELLHLGLEPPILGLDPHLPFTIRALLRLDSPYLRVPLAQLLQRGGELLLDPGGPRLRLLGLASLLGVGCVAGGFKFFGRFPELQLQVLTSLPMKCELALLLRPLLNPGLLLCLQLQHSFRHLDHTRLHFSVVLLIRQDHFQLLGCIRQFLVCHLVFRRRRRQVLFQLSDALLGGVEVAFHGLQSPSSAGNLLGIPGVVVVHGLPHRRYLRVLGPAHNLQLLL
mmetsp:Transcript_83744/g.224059  ORF Transcript_83744/g.224059 Transcript_83744/m.224059 type:complete len:259 (+) Transcript_83744:2116-2892(+)